MLRNRAVAGLIGRGNVSEGGGDAVPHLLLMAFDIGFYGILIRAIEHQGQHGRRDTGDMGRKGLKPLHMQNYGLAEIEAQVAGEQGTADGDIIK